MTPSKLNIVELSDIHLGHRTTTLAHILESLNQMFKSEVDFKRTDMVILAGDVFDRLLHLSNPQVDLILAWFHWLLRICADNDVVLRVLEGTPSHDNKQPRLIMDVEEVAKTGCDVRYIDDLHIEYIERFGIDVLYIPDEYHPDTTQTLLEVRQLMASKGLDKVDFAIMHGAFDYQIPAKLLPRIPHHNSSAYLDIVKYLIFIGHVHQYSMYDRILSAGSTDRLRHGEEEDKGFIKVTCYQSGEFEATFVVNKNAKIYKTIDVRNLTQVQAIEAIDNIVKTVPEDSYIRIKAGADNETLNALKIFKAHHPQLNWTTVTQKQENCKTELLSKPTSNMDNLHAKSLPKLIKDRLTDVLPESTNLEVVTLLKELINEHGANTPTGK